jgi:hypothetical protein
MKQKLKLPDPHVSAQKVLDVIESCTTKPQFRGALKMYRLFKQMYGSKYAWLYQQVFHDTLTEKHQQLNPNVNLQGKV